ncbi:phosphoglucomutase/phosphomannomutase family protein [Dehalococcoidia bacterium]|nr:phosphoglucomutase/phosphomannomutase family protein [Dehalococcoidia bacterium]
MPIKFGTDGWRAVIGEGYTYENLRFCAQGTADYLKENGFSKRGLTVGYDTRFASNDFAAAFAEVMAGNGIVTALTDRATPTPVVSYNLVASGAGGGAVITASHNPACWNGFKYKPDYGGSASPNVVAELETKIAKTQLSGDVCRMPIGLAERKGLVNRFDPRPAYAKHVARLVDLDSIKRSGIRVVVDSMYGAGSGYIAELANGALCDVVEIRNESNPSFPGMSQPEPLAHNLCGLQNEVSQTNADLGLATDGDADRLGIVDEDGRYISTLQTFALLCMHRLEVMGDRGPLVRSITMTSMIDRLGSIYGVPVFVTPVGFKYIGPVVMRENALAAGEESGGYAFRGGIPERDGILSGLMVMEMVAKTGKRISELLDSLTMKVGPHHYNRWDIEFDESQRTSVTKRLDGAFPATLAGMPVETIDKQDGFRFVLRGGFWVMVRFSGTEPIVRIYAEAESPDIVTDLLTEARAMAGI